MVPRDTKGLAAKLAAREQVPLLDKPIMEAFFSLHQSLLQSLHFSSTVTEVLEHQCRYLARFAS